MARGARDSASARPRRPALRRSQRRAGGTTVQSRSSRILCLALSSWASWLAE
jgi:hypothetical protein